MNSETVTVLTAGALDDPYADEAELSWDVPPTEQDVTTLAPPEPRPSNEPVQDARNAVVTGWTLYLPLDPPINAEQRIRVRGIDYPVEGDAAVWDDVGQVVQLVRQVG